MEKSFVTIALCPLCKKENGSLLLDNRLKPRFETHTMTPEPCDKCRKKYLVNGVLLLCPETGSLVVIKDLAFKRIFNVKIPQRKIVFCEQAVLDRINSDVEKV